MKALGSLAGCS